MYPDWSADGTYLVYFRPSGGDKDQGRLGSLVRRRVVDEKGSLYDKDHQAVEEELVGVLYNPQARVRVARDGRIFFAAADMTLPAAPGDMNPDAVLFSIQPGKQATVVRVAPRGAEKVMAEAGEGLGCFFNVSPDGDRISVPFQDGRVMVLDVGSGNWEWVQPTALDSHGQNNGWALRTIPVWRTETELTFAKPGAKDKDDEMVRYSVTDKTATVISGEWPEAVKADWLTAPKEATTQAATQMGTTQPGAATRAGVGK